MLRLNSKKMLMLDNGKPFSMSFTCTKPYSGDYIGVNFTLPNMIDYYNDNLSKVYNKITFDITVPSKASVSISTTSIASNLKAGTHTITYEYPTNLGLVSFKCTCNAVNNGVITISNIILE